MEGVADAVSRSPALTKRVPQLGEVAYKVASTREELEQALALVYREYLRHGYILPRYYKSGLRITPHNAVPGTTIFIIVHQAEVVGAMTFFPDSALGLPMDQEYHEEMEALRVSGRRLCEIGQLAVKRELFPPGLFSMFNFQKMTFILQLFKLAHDYARDVTRCDDLCAVVSPNALIFKFLFFEPIGPVKSYGFDRIPVKRKPALACRVNLRESESHSRRERLGVHKLFYGTTTPPELFRARLQLGVDDFRHFFVERSDVLREATPEARRVLQSWYHLSDRQLQQLLDAPAPSPTNGAPRREGPPEEGTGRRSSSLGA